MRRIGKEIWGFIFWTYERSSWRYNIMVALILSFIFFTPRSIFHDKPPAKVEMVAQNEYRIDVNALAPSGQALEAAMAEAVSEKSGHPVRIERHEAVRDAAGTLLAYKVWVTE